MGVFIEAVRILAVVWVYILRTSIGPIRVLRPDERLLPGIGSRIAQCCYTTADRPRVPGECSYGKSCGSANACYLRSASDVDTYEASWSAYTAPAATQQDYFPPRDSAELRSLDSKPFITALRPMVRLGQQSQHYERMNNPDNPALRPRISWFEERTEGFQH